MALVHLLSKGFRKTTIFDILPPSGSGHGSDGRHRWVRFRGTDALFETYGTEFWERYFGHVLILDCQISSWPRPVRDEQAEAKTFLKLS
jgi:hypothetical protein